MPSRTSARAPSPKVVAGGEISATARQPAWAPEGNELVFVGNGGLVVVGADGTGKHRLGPRVSASLPAWSPDGRLIAFGRIGEGISVMTARGEGLRRLTRNEFDDSPSWSPNSRRIAFARIRPRCGVFVVSVRGGRASKVAQHCD